MRHFSWNQIIKEGAKAEIIVRVLFEIKRQMTASCMDGLLIVIVINNQQGDDHYSKEIWRLSL